MIAILTAVMVTIMAYQVSMPAVDNAKYTIVVHEGQAFRVNTRNGEVDVCDKLLKCVPAEKPDSPVEQDK
jgi:hypothetical protein